MNNILTKIRLWLLKFLGIAPVCCNDNNEFYRLLAHNLMHVPRVFGDKNRFKVGESVVLNNALINTSSGDVFVDDYVFFGHNVSLLTGTHDYSKTGIDRQISVPVAGRDISIGKGAWLASNVTVLGPCVIGEHAVVAAGSVVIGNIPPYSIYAGVPARQLRLEASKYGR